MNVPAILRTRVTDFLRRPVRAREPLREALIGIGELSEHAYLFGGLLRDLMLGGTVRPRDVDVVVDAASLPGIQQAFSSDVKRRTRFGGLVLNVSGWRLDVWALEDTWAFRTALLPGVSFAALPATTFLNIEAIAVEVAPRSGRPRHVHDGGFSGALSRRSLEINLEPNPFPHLASVRALLLAAKTGFSIGPSLVQYILHSAEEQGGLESLVQAQWSHYGTVRRHHGHLEEWIRRLTLHRSASPLEPVYLPQLEGVQLDLWESANWYALTSGPDL